MFDHKMKLNICQTTKVTKCPPTFSNMNDHLLSQPCSSKVKVKSLNHVQLCDSMGFSRQAYWSGFPFPPPGDLPDPGIEAQSPTLQADALLSKPPGKPYVIRE